MPDSLRLLGGVATLTTAGAPQPVEVASLGEVVAALGLTCAKPYQVRQVLKALDKLKEEKEK